MSTPDRDDDLAFVSIEEQRLPQAVERLKGSLPDDPCECPACGYAGAASRWGITTYPAMKPRRVTLVVCCPSCERPADLSADEFGTDDGV